MRPAERLRQIAREGPASAEDFVEHLLVAAAAIEHLEAQLLEEKRRRLHLLDAIREGLNEI